MSDRSTIFESVQIGLEPTGSRGIAVPATRLLQALNLEAQRALTSREIRSRGNKLPSAMAPGRRSTEGTIADSAGVFGEVCYPHESIFGVTTPALAGGATLAYERLYRMNARSRDLYQSYTVEKGSEAGADRFTHGVFTSFGLSFTSEEITASGTLIGQKMADGITMTADVAEVQTITGTATAGTFTITIDLDGDAQTTGTIAFNAAAATISTALDALSNVAPGDITVGGGALGTTPVTLTYLTTGAFAGDQPLAVIDDAMATGGTVTIAATTAGVEVSALPLIAMDPFEVVIYLDATYAALGTTVLEELFAGDFMLSDKYNPRWTINRLNTSWKGVNEQAINPTLGLTLMADSQSQAILAAYEGAERLYCRIEVQGPEIEAGFDHLYQADMAVSVESLDEGDQDGALGHTWGLRMVDDPTNDLPGIEILVQNAVAAL